MCADVFHPVAGVFYFQIGGKLAHKCGRQNFGKRHTVNLAQTFQYRSARGENQRVFHKLAFAPISHRHRKLGGDYRADKHGFARAHRQSQNITRIIHPCHLGYRLDFLFQHKILIGLDVLFEVGNFQTLQCIRMHIHAKRVAKLPDICTEAVFI